MNYYIKKGEYKSEIPIGIGRFQEKYYIITPIVKIEDSCLIIGSYIGEIRNIISNEIPFDNDTYETFLYSELYSLLVAMGYESPQRVRTFLGKSAKGKLSYRKTPLKKIEIVEEDGKYSIEIYKSVNFEVFSSNSEYFITCLPNFEVYDPLYDLPLSEKRRKLLEKNDEYNKTVFLEPQAWYDRYFEYNSKLFPRLLQEKFIVNGIEIPPIKNQYLTRQEMFFVNPLKTEFKLVNASFEQQIKAIFNSNIQNLPKVEITVLIDKFNKNLNDKTEKYIIKLKECPFFTIKSEISFFEIEEINFSRELNYFLILDDKSPGKTYIYDFIKKHAKISKNINQTTIEKLGGDYIDHFLVMWLSFYSRINETLIWFKQKKYPFSNVWAIDIFYDFPNQLIRLSISRLNFKDFSIKRINQTFLYSKDSSYTTQQLTTAIVRSLKFDFDIPNEYDLYLFSANKFAKYMTDIFGKFSVCVIIEKPYCRIFNCVKGEKEKPINGVFYRIFDTKRIYLILTTGEPDRNEQGISNPLSVEIKSKDMSISDTEILQTIFDLSFYYPESFTKTNVPFIQYMNTEQLYNTIPLNFSEEDPF